MKSWLLIISFPLLMNLVFGSFDAQYAELKPRAKKGNPEAQFYLGWMYDTGKGANRNLHKAF